MNVEYSRLQLCSRTLSYRASSIICWPCTDGLQILRIYADRRSAQRIGSLQSQLYVRNCLTTRCCDAPGSCRADQRGRCISSRRTASCTSDLKCNVTMNHYPTGYRCWGRIVHKSLEVEMLRNQSAALPCRQSERRYREYIACVTPALHLQSRLICSCQFEFRISFG